MLLATAHLLGGMTQAIRDSKVSEMGEEKRLFLLVPTLVLACYAWFIAHSYSQHLDWKLKFQKPESGFSPDDVLGIGFFLPWLFFLIVFLFAMLVGLVVASHRARYGLSFLAAFGLLSATDIYLYNILEQQVIAAL